MAKILKSVAALKDLNGRHPKSKKGSVPSIVRFVYNTGNWPLSAFQRVRRLSSRLSHT